MNNMLSKLVLTSLLGVGVVSNVNADTLVGVIKGADCHLHSNNCVAENSDPHLRLERDFFLVTDSGYYFLPNLPREIKISVLNETVKINGDVMTYQVDVSEVFIKHNNMFDSVWNEEEIFYDDYSS